MRSRLSHARNMGRLELRYGFKTLDSCTDCADWNHSLHYTVSSYPFVDSGPLIAIESRRMVRKTTFVMLAVFAMLLLQFADCMSATTQDQQSMQCCSSMPCDQSNQSHDCCKGMVSSQSSSVLPTAHVTLGPPTMVAAALSPLQPVVAPSEASFADFAIPQYSPPELYTLHSSFLI